MPIDLKMPALSPTMEKGVIAKWLVGVGDVIRAGDVLAEIETDKVTMELEAVDAGMIASIVVTEGTDDVPIGTVIATIAQEGEELAPVPEPLVSTSAGSEIKLASPEPVSDRAASPDMVRGEVAAIGNRINASPLARRIAGAKGIALEAIKGSGANGRIVKADLGLRPRETGEPSAPPAIAASSARAAGPVEVYSPPAGVPYTAVKLTNMRRTIARRLTAAKQTVPHFYLSAHCNMNSLLKLRTELNGSLTDRGVKLSVNDLLIKAMALAMVREPDVNVQFADDEMYRFDRVDLAMAVAIEGGLITPIIHNASGLSLSAIAQQSKLLAKRARDGKLAPEEYQGGTASISNLGMFGIDEMFPVINPPQALILGVGSGIEKPWQVDGALGLATIMTATASFDHRVIDGAAAARFMSALRDLVEQPLQILC